MSGHNRTLPTAVGRRFRHERERQGLSLRELAERVDVNASTIMRAERGEDFAFSFAIRMVGVLGLDMSALITDPECGQCDDMPPPGFICAACGLAAFTNDGKLVKESAA
jgi:transcriptional regulator with XRE-family HTH domain